MTDSVDKEKKGRATIRVDVDKGIWVGYVRGAGHGARITVPVDWVDYKAKVILLNDDETPLCDDAEISTSVNLDQKFEERIEEVSQSINKKIQEQRKEFLEDLMEHKDLIDQLNKKLDGMYPVTKSNTNTNSQDKPKPKDLEDVDPLFRHLKDVYKRP